jgi:hypothetical protein
MLPNYAHSVAKAIEEGNWMFAGIWLAGSHGDEKYVPEERVEGFLRLLPIVPEADLCEFSTHFVLQLQIELHRIRESQGRLILDRRKEG